MDSATKSFKVNRKFTTSTVITKKIHISVQAPSPLMLHLEQFHLKRRRWNGNLFTLTATHFEYISTPLPTYFEYNSNNVVNIFSKIQLYYPLT